MNATLRLEAQLLAAQRERDNYACVAQNLMGTLTRLLLAHRLGDRARVQNLLDGLAASAAVETATVH